MTGAREGRHFLRDQIPWKARDFPADAGPFAGQNRGHLRCDLLLRYALPGRTRALNALDLQ